MPDASVEKAVSPSKILLNTYKVRAFLGATVFTLAVFTAMEKTVVKMDLFILLSYVLYFALSTAWLKVARVRNTAKGEEGSRKKDSNFINVFVTFDAFFISITLGSFSHSAIISATAYIAIIFTSTISGSHRQALSDTAATILGLTAANMLNSSAWSFDIEPLSLSILVCGLSCYFFLFATYIHKRFNKLTIDSVKYQAELRIHKKRFYELTRYVTPTVSRAINEGRDSSLKTEHKRLTIFFSDIAGFSKLSEEMESKTLNNILNTYLTEMAIIAAKHHGAIDKFMGDGLIVVFGDSESAGIKEDGIRCVRMAVEMRRKMRELETVWYNKGIVQDWKMRIGISSGYCTVGRFGNENYYRNYTVLGTHVNLASRLESAAESGEILISHETWSLVKDVVMCRDRGEIKAKGFNEPIPVYQVIDFRKELGKNQSYFEEKLPGFSMHLDLEKVRNYDAEKIIDNLKKINDRLKNKY